MVTHVPLFTSARIHSEVLGSPLIQASWLRAPYLPPLRGWAESSAEAVSEKKATLLLAEGLPLIAAKLVEKIQRWEFIDQSLLLHNPSSKSDELLLQQQGHVMIVQSVEQAQRWS